jgi:hypothetical protein
MSTPPMICTAEGCETVLPRDKRRKGTMCRPCTDKARTLPPAFCLDCGVSILPRTAKRTGRCLRCAARTPERRAEVAEALRERHADPAYKAKQSKFLRESWKRRMADPEERAAIQKRMSAVGKVYGGKVDCDRAAATRKGVATRLADIPLAYREEYVKLMHTTGLRAKERKRIILEAAAAAVRQHNKKFNQE